MAPNYVRPPMGEAKPKPSKIDRILARRAEVREDERIRDEVYKLVDLRDVRRCVICDRKGNPYATTVLGRLHHCHITDASLGGEMTTANVFLGCSECHLLRIHGKQIRVIGENADEGLEFEIDEAAVVHVFGHRQIPRHVHIVLPNGERTIR